MNRKQSFQLLTMCTFFLKVKSEGINLPMSRVHAKPYGRFYGRPK